MDLSADLIIRIIVILIYLLIGSIAFRWLLPGLTKGAKGLAISFLLAQILVIGVSLTYEAPSSFETWLWHLDREWNIPATLASAQLALLGVVALLIAWLGEAQPAWHRLYFAGLGSIFLFLAYDEYAVLHEFLVNWKDYYFVLGGAVVVATLAVAARSGRATWKWLGWLLAGLAAGALGGLIVETNCGHRIFRAIDLCDNHFLVEEPLEFVGIWLALLALLNRLCIFSPAVRGRRALYAFPLLWLLLLAGSPAIHAIERYAGDSTAADVEYETGVRLLGYRFGKSKDSVHLFLTPGPLDFKGQNFAGLGYSIGLVDQASDELVLSRDQVAHRHYFLLAPGYKPVYRQWTHIDRPETIPSNRAYWIVLTLWREDGDSYRRQLILASDHKLLGDKQAALAEFVVPATVSTGTSAPEPLALFDNGFVLDGAEIPEHARPGERLSINFGWRSEVDGSEDHAQFLHFGHVESGRWWVFDRQPLGPRLPTRLWYAGLADSETWHVPLPADLAPGRYEIFSGLYRSRDLERVPTKSAEGDYFLDARVPLGSLVIE